MYIYINTFYIHIYIFLFHNHCTNDCNQTGKIEVFTKINNS